MSFNAGRAFRSTWGIVELLLVETVIFALSAVPGLLVARAILDLPLPITNEYLETALLGVAIVPAYFSFCVALMVSTGLATRILPWRVQAGDYDLRERPWPVVRWAQYNGAIHAVRLFAGGILRATPLWTSFIRWNGARIGRNVHINTLSIYDHHLLQMGRDVVIGSDVKLSAHVAEKGRLRIEGVRIGERVTIGTNTIIQCGAEIGDGARVGVMSLVPKGARLEPGKLYTGVPVEPMEDGDHETAPEIP